MMKFKTWLAYVLARLYAVLLRLAGADANYRPGQLALKLDPDIVAHLPHPGTVLAVTGTNGKTTVSNLVASGLRAAGCSVCNNSSGANCHTGVATTLLCNTDFRGRSKADYAVLEVDELYAERIFRRIRPDWLICTNLTRDSVKNCLPGQS